MYLLHIPARNIQMVSHFVYSVLRISMTCVSTGHAAGVMAAVYAAHEKNFRYENVARILKEQGAIL
jgi:hypothetical protein